MVPVFSLEKKKGGGARDYVWLEALIYALLP